MSCPDRCYVRAEADGYAPWTSEKLTGVTATTASLNVAIATGICLHHFAGYAGYLEARRDGGKFVP